MLYDPKWTAPFKTRQQLGLSLREFNALVETLRILSTDDLPKNHRFDMRTWHSRSIAGGEEECGTVCCIGGLASIVLHKRNKRTPLTYFSVLSEQLRYSQSIEHRCGLNDLFYPYCVKKVWADITTSHAAKALRNYLTYGEPRWKEAVIDVV